MQTFTKNTWYITRTIITPALKSKKYIFKRIYHCQFKTKINKANIQRQKAHTSRNLNCPAELVIVIKRQPQQKTRAKEKDDLISDWPCVITFNNGHNHTIDSAAALVKRPIGAETKQDILNLFGKGHSVASAYNTFCVQKMEELGDQYENFVADRYYFPKKSDFSNLWNVNFKKHYGERSGGQMFFQLEDNLSKANGVLYKIGYVGDHYTVSLCTPIMQRAACELRQSSEILFVDATSNCDVQNHKLYFFATQSPAGGVPLGCIITSSQKREVFDVAVQNLWDIFPTKISPSVIVTDDDMVERNVLKKQWPNSVLLLCTFHVLKAVWKWLSLVKNNIEKADRQLLYTLFRNILLSKTQVKMEENLEQFHNSAMTAKYPQYKNYIQNMITSNMESWCLFFRQHLMIRGSETNNYIEVMFRLFKDISLERTKAYNLTQLADFVVTSFEAYYKQRLLDLVMNKLNRSTINRLSPNDGDVLPDQISELGEMQYHVRSVRDSSIIYFVDMNSNICTCPQGNTGKICKHQSAIIKHYNITNACNVLSEKSKIIIYKIATGVEPAEHLLLPLQLDECVKKSNKDKLKSGEVAGKNNNTDNNLCDQNIQLPDDNDNDNLICTQANLESIENKWTTFVTKLDCDVRKNLRDDPDGFSSAVERIISNYSRNINNPSTLMSGLITSFRNYGTPSSKVRSFIRKGKKISIQPTSVSRRKVVINGRRKIQAGRKVKGLTMQKSKAPHSLKTCVENNVGLGENKFVK